MKWSILFVGILLVQASYAKEVSLSLVGKVPLTAQIEINKNRVINKSSSGLKTRIHKRKPASIVEVSAP